MKVKNFLTSIDRHAIIAYTDKDGIITYVNDNFCKISGYSREELVGNTHRMVKSNYHPKEFYVKIWKTILKGEVWNGEICNQTKTGEFYWVNTMISPELDDDGKVSGYFAIRYDITKQKILEEENNELQRINEAVQEMAKVGGWEFAVNSERVVWTDQTYKIHEVPPSVEIKIDLAIEFYVEEDKERIRSCIDKCLIDGTPFDDVFQIVTAKGRRLWVRSIGEAVYDRNGHLRALRGTFQDVTAVKEAELKAEKERKLFLHSAKLSSLGEMASSMIHEISNPLTVVKGVMDSAKRKKSLEEVQELIEKADAPMKRLLKMVSNLRQFSRNETVNREVKENNIVDILESSLEYTRHKFRSGQVELRYKVRTPLSILCDRSEMEQVFVNILNNAIDAIESLQDRWVEIEHHQEIGKGVFITITDSGAGIPEDIVENIFDSFYTTKTKERGTGIGLGVVSDIITEHGAKIYVDRQCENTRFIIYFPEVAQQQEAV